MKMNSTWARALLLLPVGAGSCKESSMTGQGDASPAVDSARDTSIIEAPPRPDGPGDAQSPDMAPPSQDAHQSEIDTVPAAASSDLDVLFVIDNSPSMSEEQVALAKGFPSFIDALKVPGAGGPRLPDLRIGIVSTDMGAGPTAIAQCNRPGGDKAEFRVNPGCGLASPARFIASLQNGSTNNFSGDIRDVFGCMAKLGVQGCGYEHQLLATWLALDPQPGLSLANAGFLRKDAGLAIIIVTDEDDCSAPFDTDLFSNPQDIPGQANSLRCALKGHLCNGSPPPASEFISPVTSCRSNEAGKLFAVADIAAEVMKLKAPRTDRIFVSAIVGVPAAGGLYRIAKNIAGDLDYMPACSTAGAGSATPAVRVKEFVDKFGANGSLHSICSPDLGPTMAGIAAKIAAALVH